MFKKVFLLLICIASLALKASDRRHIVTFPQKLLFLLPYCYQINSIEKTDDQEDMTSFVVSVCKNGRNGNVFVDRIGDIYLVSGYIKSNSDRFGVGIGYTLKKHDTEKEDDDVKKYYDKIEAMFDATYKEAS